MCRYTCYREAHAQKNEITLFSVTALKIKLKEKNYATNSDTFVNKVSSLLVPAKLSPNK